jgi:arylformamidase
MNDRRTSPATDPELTVSFAGRRWRANTSQAHDLSIPLDFAGPQPTFFGADRAKAEALQAGTFIGDVRRGGSVNCARYTLTPHCNGTHTECVGHVTIESRSIRSLAPAHPVLCVVVSVTPENFESTEERSPLVSQPGDRLITRLSLESATSQLGSLPAGALVIRTLPNDRAKLSRNHDEGAPPPYLSAEAAQWLVSSNVEHLIVDLPSIDRASDEGRLTAHRIFWGMPAGATAASSATRAHSTITELAYVDDVVSDGLYLLSLQVAPFEAEAAPSRPILYPLVPA